METWLTPSLILSLIALILSAATGLYNRRRDTAGDWQKKIDELRREQEKTEEQLSQAKAELGIVKTKIELFWQTVERMMAKQFRDD